jgi:Alr-MurF fusion protein
LIPIRLDQLAKITGGELRGGAPVLIDRICTDSRGASPGAIFVALRGQHSDGHSFVSEAFRNGASAALVSSQSSILGDQPAVTVPNTLRALQHLARWHRHEHIKDVLAITGSNGKTIVKDALKALLAGRQVLASPGSYNSQLGLPLAILAAERPESLAILEVGISAPGEMAAMAEIASPDFGILTNIGMAHLSAFGSREAIAREKMSLFAGLNEDGWVLLPANEPTVETIVKSLRCRVYHVRNEQSLLNQPLSGQPLVMTAAGLSHHGQLFRLRTAEGEHTVRLNTRSPEIVSDLHYAASAATLLGVPLDEIASTLDSYSPTATRMEMWSSPQGIRIINDGYSSDPISVQAALRSAALGNAGGRKIFAFAGMRELGASSDREHRQVGAHAGESGFSHLFLVGGGELSSTAESYKAVKADGEVITVATPDALKDRLLPLLRAGDTVLFKGPRNAGMVKAVRDLSGAMAQRCLWINLAGIEGNIARFRRHCGSGTHILAMLKAVAYGTELTQLASWMSRLGIHHIGVSSANEGAALRKSGADQDIFVFLSEREDVDNLLRYRLTPVIYSAELVEAFAAALANLGQTLNVHLKVDTGMHRLGVAPEIAPELAQRIRKSGVMHLTGICTHFASADDPEADAFTLQQITTFEKVVSTLRTAGFNNLQVHAANTAAAMRFPQAHYDMVRIGLGLYGLYPSPAAQQAMELELAIGVTSRISSIQQFEPGDTLGYGRSYKATRTMKVGVVPFGYDDGLPWRLANTGKVMVAGQLAPIVGRISMDQMQIDLTDIPGVTAGSEILIYGTHNGQVLRPELVAEQAGTISYELLTRLGERVHRIYIEP